jgi:hypothetical protein
MADNKKRGPVKTAHVTIPKYSEIADLNGIDPEADGTRGEDGKPIPALLCINHNSFMKISQ